MAQAALGSIDPNAVSGTQLASLLEAFGVALESGNSGTSRPSYAAAGTMWVDTTTTTNLLKFFTGSADIILLSIDTVGNTVQLGPPPSGSAPATNYVVNTRNVSTTKSLTGGGSLASDLTLQLVNDVTSAPANSYYGTNGSGTKGWNALPTVGAALQLGFWTAAGTYNWSCPAGVTGIVFQGWGGGGSAAFDGTTAWSGGWGCPAAGFLNVTPGQNYSIIIGGGGAGADYVGNGNAGGPTQFGSLLFLGGGGAGQSSGYAGSGGSVSLASGAGGLQGVCAMWANNAGQVYGSPGTYEGAPGMSGMFALWQLV